MILPAVIVWLAFSGFAIVAMMMGPWGMASLRAWAEIDDISLVALLLVLFVSLLILTLPLAFMYWVALRAVMR